MKRKYADYTYKAKGGIRIRIFNRGQKQWDADIHGATTDIYGEKIDYEDSSVCIAGAIGYYKTKRELIKDIEQLHGKIKSYIGTSLDWKVEEIKKDGK